jgi:SNF2 family DNA or RNA helicase
MPIVTITRGRRDGSIVLRAGSGASFRELERALLRSNVDAVAVRALSEIHADAAALDAIHDALEAWDVEGTAEITDAIARRHAVSKSAVLARQALQAVQAADDRDLLIDYPERDRLDRHQIQAVAVIVHRDVGGVCIFDEQGLGKTVTALFAFDCLRSSADVTKLLVIAPKNMLLEWTHDAARFFGTRYAMTVVEGTERQKRRQLESAADILVTNFETASTLFLKLRNLLRAEAKRAMLVIDESFFVKNSEARRTKAIRKLRDEVTRCVVLCGTPAPNSAADIVEQFNIADGGVTFDGFVIPEDRSAAAPLIQARMQERGVYLRRLKQDVMPDMPLKQFRRLLITMQPEQRRAYAQALRAMIDDLRLIDDIQFRKNLTSFMARRAALIQICSSPNSVVANYDETPAKILVLDALLDELIIHRGEKVVVWSYFTASLETIFNRYSRFHPVRCDGRVPRAQARREAVRRFQEDKSTMLFVANPAAAGAGITLHRARYAIYESMSNQPAHYLQSLDRIHRRGQNRDVEYLVLLCDGTIELSEYDRLVDKESAAQYLLKDNVTPARSRTEFLAEAQRSAEALDLS